MTPSQLRASLILQVRSGQITAQQAAQQLGISRQAFYKWEKRALKALISALEDQPWAGPRSKRTRRRTNSKTGWEELERKVRLYQQRETLRTLLKEMEESAKVGSSTKNSK